MTNRSKLLFAALTAALLLAALVGTASANRLSSSEQNFRVTYAPMTFTAGTGQVVTCNVTLEGSFHSRTISKVAEALIGYVNRTSVASCTPEGGARANTETLPWHIHYIGFEGTLPNITNIIQSLHRSSFEVRGSVFGFEVNCRYTPESEKARNNRETRGVVRTQTIVEEPAASETFGCPTGKLSGTGAVSTPTGGTIAVSLI